MKKLSFVIIVIALLSSVSVEAQNNKSNVLDGSFVRTHVSARKPVPYYYLREADVAWSKKVWRILDLREKKNQVFYYPLKPTDDRMNLMSILIEGITGGNNNNNINSTDGIEVYEYDEFNEFGNVLTYEKIKEDMGATTITTEEQDPVTGEYVTRTIPTEANPAEITRFLMKEEWFFNKNRSKMEVRIIGLCPVRRFIKETDAEGVDMEDMEMTMKTLFWAYFKAYRPAFANHGVFNPFNDAERRTFDDIFIKRKFASHIYRITNVHENRRIETYKKGEDALLEAERLQAFIFNFEQDLWEN